MLLLDDLLIVLSFGWSVGLLLPLRLTRSRLWDWGILVLGALLVMQAIQGLVFGFLGILFVIVLAVIVLRERMEVRRGKSTGA